MYHRYSELLTQFGCDVQIGATTTSLSERLGDLPTRRGRPLDKKNISITNI